MAINIKKLMSIYCDFSIKNTNTYVLSKKLALLDTASLSRIVLNSQTHINQHSALYFSACITYDETIVKSFKCLRTDWIYAFSVFDTVLIVTLNCKRAESPV